MRLFITYFVLFTFLFSCEKPKEISHLKVNPEKVIKAVFQPSNIDYQIAPKCDWLTNKFDYLDSEIVLIKEEEYKSIIDRLANLNPSKEDYHCPSDFSFFVGRDKYCSCIYDEQFILKNGQLYEISDTLLFDIKLALTFYNSREKEYLKSDALIQKFGIPKNYKYQEVGEKVISYDEKGNKTEEIISIGMRMITLSVENN